MVVDRKDKSPLRSLPVRKVSASLHLGKKNPQNLLRVSNLRGLIRRLYEGGLPGVGLSERLSSKWRPNFRLRKQEGDISDASDGDCESEQRFRIGRIARQEDYRRNGEVQRGAGESRNYTGGGRTAGQF